MCLSVSRVVYLGWNRSTTWLFQSVLLGPEPKNEQVAQKENVKFKFVNIQFHFVTLHLQQLYNLAVWCGMLTSLTVQAASSPAATVSGRMFEEALNSSIFRSNVLYLANVQFCDFMSLNIWVPILPRGWFWSQRIVLSFSVILTWLLFDFRMKLISQQFFQ